MSIWNLLSPVAGAPSVVKADATKIKLSASRFDWFMLKIIKATEGMWKRRMRKFPNDKLNSKIAGQVCRQ